MLAGISKAFAGEQVLSHLDLSLSSGQSLAVIGPSGCGKSTLLRLINGLLLPDAGKVMIAGEQLTQQNVQQLRHRMGYVIQEGGLFPHLTARQNVTLLADYLGWSAEKIHERLEELCELSQLDQRLLQRYPAQLSGGQRQRVALLRALMLDPEFLLLDEPLGALDPMIRYDLQTELRNIFERLGKTLLLVTHDLAEAAYLADEIALMRAGRIVQLGPMQELVDHPAEPFVEQFVRAQRGHRVSPK